MLFVVLFIALAYIPIHASTVSEKDYTRSVYEKKVETPFSVSNSNNETISLATGSMQLRYTDISLKGKNGLDFHLTRIYDQSKAFVADMIRDREFHTYYDYHYDLGDGWYFDIPILEVYSGSPSVLHYGLKGIYFIDGNEGDTYTFTSKKENFELRIDTSDDVYNEDGKQSVYVLTEKNGLKLYFDINGKLMAKVDRYGNEIKYYYHTYSDPLGYEYWSIKKIIDSCGRQIIFNVDQTNNCLQVSVTGDGITKTLYYNFAKVKDKTDLRINNYIYDHEKVLESVTDFEGRTTTYKYNYELSKESNETRIKNDIPYNNMHTLLQEIKYPSDGKTLYTYAKSTKGMGENGCLEFFKLTSRQDINASSMGMDTTTFNQKHFTYNIDSTFELDGYPFYTKVEDIPDDYQVKTKEEITVNGQKNTNIYTYNKDGLLIHQEQSGNNHKIDKVLTYDENNLPLKTVTKVYNKTTSQYMTTVEDYEYDKSGNLLYYWGPLAKRDINNQLLFRDTDDYKVSYTYDSRYNLQTSKTYKRHENSTIKEENTLSSDGKKVDWSKVYENNTLQEQARYIYDVYGNSTEQRNYVGNGNWSDYIPTYYTYRDGTYLTEKRITGIKDADNNLIPAVSGQAAGTISENMTYDYFGNVTQVKNGEGQATTFQYDKLGRVKRMTNPDGTYSTKAYTTNTSENSITETNENGHSFKTIYDQIGREVYKKDLTTNITLQQIKYDDASRVKETIDANGNRTVNTYLSDSRVSKKQQFDTSDNLLYNEEYEYDEAYNNGELYKTKKRIFGNPWFETISYTDKVGRVVKTETPHNDKFYVAKFKYDYVGNVIEEKNARAHDEAWSNAYTMKTEYDYAGRVIKVTNINGDYTSTEYDALGRMIKFYDIKGNKAQTPYYTTSEYDNLGRLIKSSIPFEEKDGIIHYTTTKNYFDRNSNMITEESSNNMVGASSTYTKKSYTYNNRNMLTAVITYDNNLPEQYTQYYYSKTGDMLRMYTGLSDLLTITGLDEITPGNDTIYSVTKNNYDHLGRIKTTTDPLGQAEKYDDYDSNGNLLQKTDRNGNTTTFTYDGLNRILTKNVSNPNSGESINHTYSYNHNGTLTSESDGTITTSYTYDDLGRVISEDNGTETKTYTYDAHGNRLSLQIMKNAISIINTSYTYDNMNRLTTVTENGALKATYTYDENNNRKTLDYSNGNRVCYNYNLANLVTELINKESNTELSHYTNAYNLSGLKVEEHESIHNKVTTYTYDDLGRLQQETNKLNNNLQHQLSYTYDDASNRASLVVTGDENYSIHYSYDPNNRLSFETKMLGQDIETTNYTYDPNGNTLATFKELVIPMGSEDAKTYILEAGKSSNTDITINHYNLRNQLIKTDTNGIRAEYTYNSQGIRISKKVNDEISTFILDRGNVVAEQKDNNTIVYARGINLISRIRPDGEEYYLFNDHGDVVHQANDAGSIIKNYDYDAFGIEMNVDATDENPFRYSGEYYDGETGSYYLRARYYNPYIGRFITEDSYLGNNNDPLSLNLYTYCSNNPVMYVDPTGHTQEHDSGSGGNYGYIVFLKDADTMNAFLEYLNNSGVQIVKGNYTDEVTLLGTGGQVVAGFVGVDAPMDVRDIVHDFQYWEWSLGHAGQTLVDMAALIPVIGALKYSDEVATLVKGGKKANGLDGVRIINKKYADEVFELSGDLAKKYPDGVKFTKEGFPDFSPYSTKTVTVEGMQGDAYYDFIKANQAAGYQTTPKGFTWHHVEDGTTMMLVPSDLHGTVRHTGGASLIRKGIRP